MKNNLIYGLQDPRNDVYMYIGKTTVGLGRPIKHLHYSHNNSVREWVSELNDVGLEPVIIILEEGLNLGDLSDREKYWIGETLEVNPSLLNEQLKSERIPTINLDVHMIDNLVSVLTDLPTLIKGLRLKYNLRQSDLVELVSPTRSVISRLENGDTNVSIQTLIEILTVKPEENGIKYKIRRR